MSERDEFEAWARRMGYGDELGEVKELDTFAMQYAWQGFQAARAPQAVPAQTDEQMAAQDARYAIDGAIAYGRMGVNPPPAGHWLTEYWSIGQQLAELGKTSAWDNQTPADSRASPVKFARYDAMEEAGRQASEEMCRLEKYLDETSGREDSTAYIARLRNGSKTWLAFSKYRWDRLDSTWDKRVAVLGPLSAPQPSQEPKTVATAAPGATTTAYIVGTHPAGEPFDPAKITPMRQKYQD